MLIIKLIGGSLISRMTLLKLPLNLIGELIQPTELLTIKFLTV